MASIIIVGQRLPLGELLGVLVISAGLISLVFVGGRPTPAELSALAAAFGTGILIGTYTLIDAAGVQTTNVISYAGWMFLFFGPTVPLLALVLRGRALVR